MGDQPDEVWVWGKVDVREHYVLLTGNGGYKCNFCGTKLRSDRYDLLMGHLNKCKVKPKDFDKKSLNKTIRKIRSRCERCHAILDLSGTKKERHLEKYCKGQLESATAKKIKKVEEENKKLKEKIDSRDVEMCEKIKEFEEKTNKLNEENKKLKEEMCEKIEEFEMYKEKSRKEFEENKERTQENSKSLKRTRRELKEDMSKIAEMYKDKCKKVEESQKIIDVSVDLGPE